MGAGRKSWVYRTEQDGTTRAIPLEEAYVSYTSSEPLTFEQRMVKNLYELEQKEGSRFRVPSENGQDYRPSDLKRIWIDNVERDAVIDHRIADSRERAKERAMQ